MRLRGMRIRFIQFTTVVILVTTVFAGASKSVFRRARLAQESPNGKLRGFVFDPNESLIPNAKITIKGKTLTREIVSNSEGLFEAELPPGVYDITSREGIYYPLRRASFHLDANSTTTINLRPNLRVTSIGLEITKAGLREPMTFESPPSYDTFRLTPRSPLNLLVQFENKKRRGKLIEYQNAWASYDSLLIYADYLQVGKAPFRIACRGRVLVEDNGKPTRGNELVLTLDKGQPEWSLR